MANLAAQSISKMQIVIPQAGHLDFEGGISIEKTKSRWELCKCK